MPDLRTWGPMTVLMVAVALIVVLAGAITVVTGSYDDDFARWVDDLKTLALAIAGLGGARAILEGSKRVAAAKVHPDAAGNSVETSPLAARVLDSLPGRIDEAPDTERRDIHEAPGA